MADHDRLGEVLLLLGRLDGKVDGLLASRSEDRSKVEALEKRLRCLESWKAKAVGMSVALSAIATGAINLFTVFWSKT